MNFISMGNREVDYMYEPIGYRQIDNFCLENEEEAVKPHTDGTINSCFINVFLFVGRVF